jgi:hypothetical protein
MGKQGLNKKLSLEEVDKRLKNKNIERVDEYKNTYILSNLKCLVCGKIFKAKIKNIFDIKSDKNGCSRCAKCEEHTNEMVDERLIGTNIQRIGDYKNAMIKIKFKCLIHNYIWECRPSQILNHNSKCPICAKNGKLNNEIVDIKFKEKHFKRIGNVVNSKDSIEYKCTLCNKHFKSSINSSSHIHKNCDYDKSRSEHNIERLIKENIKYTYFEPHKKIVLEHRKIIPDFYLEMRDKKIFIEYNGRQHYMPVTFNGRSEEAAKMCFEKQKIRDEQLREYCKENNFILLEIPYYWKEFEVIKQLTLLNNIA